MRRWEEEEYYRRIAEEERFWEEENRRRFEVEFYEGWGPGRMGPPRGPPGPMGPRPLMEGVGDMGPVRINSTITNKTLARITGVFACKHHLSQNCGDANETKK